MMKARKHRRKLAVATVGVLMLIGVSSTQAATVLIDPTNETNAIGIVDLVVGRYVFNVRFETNTAAELYGFLPPFELDPDGFFNRGIELTALVNDALNTEPAVTRVGELADSSPSNQYNYAFAVDRGTANLFAFATVGNYSAESGAWIVGQGEYQPEPDGPGFVLNDYDRQPSTYAVLDFEGVVPIPAAVWLFGSALLGLVGIARRKLAA